MRHLGSVLVLFLFACGGNDLWELEELDDSQGISLRLPAEDIPAASESQNCFFMKVPDINNGQPIYISRFHSAINPGSHHMNVFRVRTIKNLKPTDGEPVKIGPYDATLVRGYDDFFNNPCWGSSNWSDWPLVANSQNSDEANPYTDWVLPEGVAIKFEPGEEIMIQTHYVNTTIQPTVGGGKVGINFHKFQGSGTPIEMGSLFATKQSIRVCRSTGTARYTGACNFPGDHQTTISAANGHFHSRGKRFTMYTWDGRDEAPPAARDMFYESLQWDHPPMTTNIERKAPMGGGIRYTCEFQWIPPTPGTCEEVDAKDPEKAGDCCYTFGGNTDVGEHCNVFLYYYPRVDDGDVFCN